MFVRASQVSLLLVGGLNVWYVDVEKDRVRYLWTGTSIPKVGPRNSHKPRGVYRTTAPII